MSILKNIQPERVFYYFEELSAIPRGSGNEEAVAKFKESTGIDLDADPEKTIVHPAMELGRIYDLVGKQYNKHLSDISAIMSILTTDDFCKLMDTGKCNTFKKFVESLLGEQ